MLLRHFIGLASLSLPILGTSFGCSRHSDPVAEAVEASNTAVTVAPEAKEGPEGADKLQREMEKKQMAADKGRKR